MRQGETVVGGDGRPLILGPPIASGGEGAVFEVASRPNRAIKIYHPPERASRRHKIGAMVGQALSRKSDLVAFPIDSVASSGGEFLGFVMRRVSGHRPVFQLYIPGDRMRYFPQADHRFLIRAATNVARALAGVHYARCVVGDINQSGVLVSDQATVALIDADSFQVDGGGQRFLCRVGVEEYTAPELRGRDFERHARTQNHDAFALATLLFQLLFLGRLPFVGRPTGAHIEMGDAIREHRFAWSQRRDTGMVPPRGAVTLSDLSPMLAGAFESAFAAVGSVGLRPKAMQWVDLLQRFEAELIACTKNARHLYHPHAGGCTWCRIATETGVDPF